MKILDHETFEPAPAGGHAAKARWARNPARPDRTRCTRCGQPWGCDLVEKVEIWSCIRCGYEARERSSDSWRARLAQRESAVSRTG